MFKVAPKVVKSSIGKKSVLRVKEAVARKSVHHS